MFDFDEVVDRKGTNCAKWDTIEAKNKPKDVLPMWVADMDFKSPKEIENALVKRIKQGVYTGSRRNLLSESCQYR